MKASDFQKPVLAVGVNRAVMDKHDKRAGRRFDWAATRIQVTDAGRESDPFRERHEARDLGRRPTRRLPRGTNHLPPGRSYTVDSAYVGSFLHPDQDVNDAITDIGIRLAMRQKDDSTLGYWAGLKNYLGDTMPEGSTIRDCNPHTLAPLLEKLIENVN